MPFHGLWSGADAATGVSFSMNPASLPGSFSRVLSAADVFAHYRLRSLSFRVLPTATPVTVGFVGGVQDTLPSTAPQILELLPSQLCTAATTVVMPWVKVSKEDLAGPLPWYKSVNGAADATEESPGAMVLNHTASAAYNVEIQGVYEFKTAVATANTPVQLAARREVHVARQREALLRVLAAPSAVGLTAALAAGK